MKNERIEEMVGEFKVRFSPLVDVTGFNDEYTKEEYRPSPRDRKIMGWLRTALTTIDREAREEAYKMGIKHAIDVCDVHHEVESVKDFLQHILKLRLALEITPSNTCKMGGELVE
jgi:hypothetical protein